MKRLTLLLILFGITVNSPQVFADSLALKPIMKEIGSDFKLIFKAVLKGDNSLPNQQRVIRLKENIFLAKMTLPENVDPTDQVSVERFQSIMDELQQQIILLQDSFATNPLDKDEALIILKEMDSIRKKGHAVFR